MCENGPRSTCQRPPAGLTAWLRWSQQRFEFRNSRLRWRIPGLSGGAGFDGTVHDAALCMWWGRHPFYTARVPAGAGWKTGNGWTAFRDGQGRHTGIRSILVNRALVVTVRGPRVVDNPYGWRHPYSAPPDPSAHMEVQLHAANGKCFAATHRRGDFVTRDGRGTVREGPGS